MEIRQLLRLVVFGYFSFLPNFASFWASSVLPEILEKDLKITDKTQQSKYGGLFYTYYFIGLILGCFAWPYLIKYLSKRMSVLIGLAFQGVFTYFTGQATNLNWFFFFRILTGFFNNINTVGKDFIFEFTKPQYRQYAFSLKSSFTMLAMWVGPLLGYFIYVHYNRSFADSMQFLAILYMIGCILFVIFFYLDFSPLEMDAPAKLSISLHDMDVAEEIGKKRVEEENLRIIDDNEVKRKKETKGIGEVLKIVWKNRTLRNFVIVYLLTNGIGTTKNILIVFYLETLWNEGGLDISPLSISFLNLIVFGFSLLFLMVSPLVVPSKIGYLTMIRHIVIMMILVMILMPLLRDLLPNNTEYKYILVIYISYGVTSFFSPKLFSPFLNFLFNDRIGKNARTSMNSITFIGSVISATISMVIITPFYSISMHESYFKQFEPYNKYLVFLMMDISLIICLFFLRSNTLDSEI